MTTTEVPTIDEANLEAFVGQAVVDMGQRSPGWCCTHTRYHGNSVLVAFAYCVTSAPEFSTDGAVRPPSCACMCAPYRAR